MTMELTTFAQGYSCSHCGGRIKKDEEVFQADHGCNRGKFSLHGHCALELAEIFKAPRPSEDE